MESGMKFTPDGIPHLIGGVRIRVVKGRKAPNDMKLEICCNEDATSLEQRWQAVPMTLVAYMTEFFYKNEDVLYPRSEGYLGGEKFLMFLRDAVENGYETATAGLEWEKAGSRG
jgi:hypothetical protein